MLEPEFSGADAQPEVTSEQTEGGSFARLAGYSLPRTAWLNVLLFAITLVTCTAFGSAVVESFRTGKALSFDLILDAYVRLVRLDPAVWSGWRFSVPLLLVLFAHELGHYVECLRRGVDASLPYFLPSPTLFGTFGAFIRIRSPIYDREGLFDIGVLGPLAGVAALIPILIVGVSLSKVVGDQDMRDAVSFGTPLAIRLLELLRFPGVAPAHIALHPMALAAWVGLFATSFNLLPIGQLDGGHIVYALGREEWHKRISLAMIGVLAVLGFLYRPWWIWSVVLFFFGRRHPLVYDDSPLPRSRVVLVFFVFLILLLSISIAPVRTA